MPPGLPPAESTMQEDTSPDYSYWEHLIRELKPVPAPGLFTNWENQPQITLSETQIAGNHRAATGRERRADVSQVANAFPQQI